MHLNPPRAFSLRWSQLMQIMPPLQRMSRVCVFVFVLFGCCELSWSQRIIQVGKDLRAHGVQQLCCGRRWLRGEMQPQQGGSVHAALSAWITSVPCCAVPARMSAVTFVAAEAPSSGTDGQSSSGASSGCLAGQRLWEENTDTNLQ